MNILLVEDALDVQAMVKGALSKKFPVVCVGSAEEGALELNRSFYDLIILDIDLPGEDGFKFCATLRASSNYHNVPIVFLTGKSQTEDKVLAYTIGADDYIVKPFDLSEFQARIEARVRRLEKQSELQNQFIKGPFRVALAEQKIFLNEHNIDLGLSTLEFKLLYYFLRHENIVLHRNQILSEVWGATTHVTDRAVDTYIYAIRKKLGKLESIIQSVPRVGYRLSFSDYKKI